MELESCISSLEKDVDKCCSEGKKQYDFSKFLKANELRNDLKSRGSPIKKTLISKFREFKEHWQIDFMRSIYDC